jgi:hypothetical protein
MAKKKSRRARRKRVQRKAEQSVTTPSPTQRSVKALDAQAEPTSGQGFSAQYSYVYDDLKRIALLAGTLLVVLVALSFVVG